MMMKFKVVADNEVLVSGTLGREILSAILRYGATEIVPSSHPDYDFKIEFTNRHMMESFFRSSIFNDEL
jgi:hypothetical protein